jgi:hypothetical protein
MTLLENIFNEVDLFLKVYKYDRTQEGSIEQAYHKEKFVLIK